LAIDANAELPPNAFVSAVDPSTGRCYGGDSLQNCQFGSLGRNALRGPDFFWNDFYLTKWFPVTEQVKLRLEAQFFNVFNHPNFGLPSDSNSPPPDLIFCVEVFLFAIFEGRIYEHTHE
jgi:hypothetical protein